MQQRRFGLTAEGLEKLHAVSVELAAWISENFEQELCIPPKRDQKWTVGELNAILENNLVPNHGGKGQLRTFGCIQWECKLYSGRPKARCYPFNLKNHRFRGKNRQVLHKFVSYDNFHDIIYDIICDIIL